MSAQPESNPTGAQTGGDLPYQLINLGGETAAVVPLAELRRLRALERIASLDELAEAEGAAKAEELDALEAAGPPRTCRRRKPAEFLPSLRGRRRGRTR